MIIIIEKKALPPERKLFKFSLRKLKRRPHQSEIIDDFTWTIKIILD